jgi:hypothetical protein
MHEPKTNGDAISTIPHHPGWKLLSVKSANWRYWIVMVQDPVSKHVEELFLFADAK